jgi:integrase
MVFTEFYKKLSNSGVRLNKKYCLNGAYVGDCKRHKATIALNAGISLKTIDQLIKGGNTTNDVAERVSYCIGIPIRDLFALKSGEGGLDPKTIRHHHRLLTSVFNIAMKLEIIDRNPVKNAVVPEVEKKEAKAYDANQAVHMLRLLIKEPMKYQAAIYIALYGGLRLGEVTGLDWDSVDLHAKTLSITKSRQYTPERGTYDKKPKTKSSKRTISISDDVIYILEEHKKEQDIERRKLGDQWKESGKIFTQRNGIPMFPDTPSNWFNHWLKRVGLPPITFHQLRHTHASILIAEGVDIASIARRLGHSNIQTTLSTYAHAFEQADPAIASLLGDVLSPETKPALVKGFKQGG